MNGDAEGQKDAEKGAGEQQGEVEEAEKEEKKKIAHVGLQNQGE